MPTNFKKSHFLLLTIMMSCFLLGAGSAFALPSTGDTVFMENDWSVPYSLTFDGVTYDSFCLESGITFTPNNSYFVEYAGDVAISGGTNLDPSVSVINAWGNEVEGDQVSQETMLLYAAYMSNIFDELDNAAAMVQVAIWVLEDEAIHSSLSGYYYDGIDTYLLQYALAEGFGVEKLAKWNIIAVNLYKNGDRQSQLIGAPVPEPATLMLLGTGLLGMGFITRRRLRK